MIKEFLIRKMIESKLSMLPPEQRETIIKVVTENPEFFQKIAEEAKSKIDAGMDEQTALMEVMQSHQGELQNLLR